jgi:hypothetical protein
MIKLLDIIEEGTITLTPEERQQVETMIPDIISNIKKPLLPNDKVYNIGNIKYKFADGEDGEVKIVVGYPGSDNAKGVFRTYDPKNRTDNWIVINPVYFSQFFPSSNSFSDFDQRLSRTVTGNENTGIERLRQTLKHELIHAKDPALNHHYLKEPYSSEDEAIYYKSWTEFQTFTGQFFESLISGTDRVLNSSDNPGDIKRIEKALSNILQYFAGKTKNISLETKEFIDGTGSRNFFQKIFNFLHQIVRMPSDSDYALSEYLTYLTKIKQYNPEGYKEFLKDLYKTIKSIEEKVNSVSATKIKVQEMKQYSNKVNHKNLNSQIKKLVNEVITEINYSAIPKTIKLAQEEFIKSIPNNDYFIKEEKQALALYFKSYSNFHNKNIMLFETQINEDIAGWFKSGWQKIKSAFGGIKNYVTDIWDKIKNFFKDLIVKGKSVAKGLIDKSKEKLKAGIVKALNGPNKDDLLAEFKHIIDVANWINTKINSPENLLTPISNKVVEPTIAKAENAVEKIQENIFTKKITAHLVNSNLLLESEDESNWKKWLMNIVKIVLNPVMGGLGVVGSWVGSKMLSLVSKLIEKLGGPKAIEYHITPELVFANLEISGAYEGVWGWVEEKIKEYAKYIPYAGELIELWHFGHKILVGYAIYEVIKEIVEGLGSAVKNVVQESLSLEYTRMQKLAGLK